mmetsp:Transcript_6357/g.13848  ORF Transcript_6357/g.13848 Transcript_6357/m.13848 type:complete len:223 (-) Transcript_6357:714-1382(-)
MTANEILKIAATVAIVQAVCDLLTNKYVFSSEDYERVVSRLRRAETLRDKAANSKGTNADKHAKRLAKAEDERAAVAAEVARRHTMPTMITSVVFLMLWKILGSEHHGKIVAVLPFQPFGFLQRLTLKGLDISEEVLNLPRTAVANARGEMVVPVSAVSQACSFAFIYVLCSLSVKFVVNKLLSKKPPVGADGGLTDLLGNPQLQRSLKTFGIDVDELKKEM